MNVSPQRNIEIRLSQKRLLEATSTRYTFFDENLAGNTQFLPEIDIPRQNK